MALKLDKTMMVRDPVTDRLTLGVGRELYVLETNGALDRYLSPGWDLGDETLVEGFYDEALTSSAGTGPFTANTEGQFDIWLPADVYDLYAPTDSGNRITRWQPVDATAAAGIAALDTRADALESDSASHATDIAVVKEAPLNLAHPEYGLVNGASIDTPLTTAKTALGANGGRILVPAGSFTSSAPPSFDSTRSVEIMGMGGLSAGAQTKTQIVYTGTGTLFSARSSFGFKLRDMQLLYNNASMAAAFVNLSKGAGGDTAYAKIIDCYIGGSGVRGAVPLLELGQAIACEFYGVIFAGSNRAVRGLTAAPDANNYSNGHTFYSCTFKDQTFQHVMSPHESWTFVNPIVQQLVTAGGASAGAGFITYGAGQAAENLTIVGGWFGDADTTGDWINFLGNGLTVLGAHIGSGNVGIRLDAGNIDGVVIKGNRFDNINTAGIALGGTGNKNFEITGNHKTAGTPNLLSMGGTFPTGSRIQDHTGGGAYVYQSDDRIFTAAVSDASFAFTPCDGMSAVEDVGGVRKACWRIGGVWYKATLA